MVFKLFSRKKPQPPREPDPLAAYDAFIEDLERQGSEIRKHAAALLTVRGELTRAAQRYEQRLGEIGARKGVAQVRSDAKAAATMDRDRAETQRLLESTRESLAKVEEDAQLLMEAAQDVTAQVTELKAERTSAHARLSAGTVVTEALRARKERFDRVLALDAARDEIERAHALADIYREEREGER